MDKGIVTRNLISVLDAANPKKADTSYELHGIFRLIPGMASQLTYRDILIQSIRDACKRFNIIVAEDVGLTGRLAKTAVDALIEADVRTEAESA